MIFIYLETPLGVTGNYVLYPLWDIFPVLAAASNYCPVVHLPGDCGEICMSFDESENTYGVLVMDGASEFLLEWECVV